MSPVSDHQKAFTTPNNWGIGHPRSDVIAALLGGLEAVVPTFVRSSTHTVELLGANSNRNNVTRLLSILAGEGRDCPPARPTRSPRQRQRRLTSEEIDGVVGRYKAGESANVLAGELGVHRTTIVGHLKRRGVLTRYRIITEKDLAEAARLYEEGWSLARVGEHFGVSARTVMSTFRAARIATRPVGTNQWSAGS